MERKTEELPEGILMLLALQHLYIVVTRKKIAKFAKNVFFVQKKTP